MKPEPTPRKPRTTSDIAAATSALNRAVAEQRKVSAQLAAANKRAMQLDADLKQLAAIVTAADAAYRKEVGI